MRGMTEEEKAENEKQDRDVLANSILNHQTNSNLQARKVKALSDGNVVCSDDD